MSFLSRLLNLAGGKLSELSAKDETLSDERLAKELNATPTKPSAAAQAELTLRKQAPKDPDASDEGEPVEKRL